VTSVGANETGLNPAWRNTLAHLVILDSWPEGATISVIESARDRLRLFLTRITQLAPGLGSYFNEVRLLSLPCRSRCPLMYPELFTGVSLRA
jgi:hypothetical protein